MDSTSRPSIVAVLEHYGASPSEWGGWHPLRCPFHDDHRASASVNSDEEVFKCFVCTNDKGDPLAGDAFAIVMAIEGVDFATATRRIQEWTGYSGSGISSGDYAGRSKLPSWTRTHARSGHRVSAWNRH